MEIFSTAVHEDFSYSHKKTHIFTSGLVYKTWHLDTLTTLLYKVQVMSLNIQRSDFFYKFCPVLQEISQLCCFSWEKRAEKKLHWHFFFFFSKTVANVTFQRSTAGLQFNIEQVKHGNHKQWFVKQHATKKHALHHWLPQISNSAPAQTIGYLKIGSDLNAFLLCLNNILYVLCL